MKIKKIIILGTGGNCIDILDSINEINIIKKRYKVIGFLDDDKTKWNTKIHDIEVLGGLKIANSFKDIFFVNGIGSPNNFWKKEEILDKAKLSLDRFETIIHPSASVSKMSNIGKGTVILQNVTISSNVTIGNHVMILPNSVINHDDIIDSYVSIASGVCIAGNIKIEKNSLIGIGCIVLNDIKENNVVVGNPARFLRKLY